ncbi:hypothetical protein ACFWBH_02875 [Streptomyces sp. NPDC059999]|uniref:hypothetical protein n=1 Tax=Streptomyces sp. NPDC059999 TaxID=3347030 RepID=UPI00368C6D7D
MRGDETQRGSAPDAESRERKGPRHAAPRKSLLTKFQIPVGKTMALAAMPTAVFVGMGMAPKLALADDKDIPFAPGPCVTRSDEPAESASPSASKSPSPSASASTSPSATPSPGASAVAPKPGTKPSASKPTTPEKAKQSTPAATPSASASPSPSASAAKPTNPLDPLGVGDKVKDFFDELGKPLAQKPATPAPTTSTAPKPDPSADAIREAAKQAGAKVEELPQDVKDTAKSPKDETGKATDKDKSDKDKADKDKSDEKKDDDEDKTSPSPSPSTSATKDADGKEPFPCPTLDAKALADAKLEPGIPLLPDEPWYLDSSRLTLYGLDYAGIVEVKTAGGKVKKVLKFTADSLDIKDLYQTVGKEGNVAHLKSRPGSTSTIRGATVTMYTESLKGNLFGLIPIEFTPNSPPPLNVPFAFFTNVKVVQAGQFGGNLTVPGLKNYVGPPE